MNRLLPLLLLVGACDWLPRDAAGTLDHVTASRQLRVGAVATPGQPLPPPGKALVVRLEQATGAQARITAGGQEPLFAALRKGRLDLVLAPLTRDTPWKDKVALAPPLAVSGEGDTRLFYRAAARNGENRWVMLLERQSRLVAPDMADES